ncbi:helix-turn-helix domain-containing protein [Paenibacillus odorifer]|uniref:helix-turn-helix domain-containing protein n=1 Tax=Paenibacillus odorifer TaxID=189426 RepID=UPI00096F2A50|nr:helix-turn-helix transcriptional regulator [Paenibacillus odorifer]OMD08408.1 hypothetical protein BJP50_07405 [Paenibacillus odorifer]
MIKCNLAEILARRGLKIRDVSEKTGISRTTLTALSYNQGKGVQFETFNKICSFLDITPGDLFTYFDFDMNVLEVHPSKNEKIPDDEHAFFLDCEFILKDQTFIGRLFCVYEEKTNKFKVMIWTKLLNRLEIIPNYILIQLFIDYFQDNLIANDLSTAHKELALYDGEIDEWMEND